MRIVAGDMKDVADEHNCKNIGFTANAYIGVDGALCMGRGAALAIKSNFPGVDIKLGKALGGGSSVLAPDYHLIAVPYQKWTIAAIQTKRHFNDHRTEATRLACWDVAVESINRLASWQKELGQLVVINFPLIGDAGFAPEEARVTKMLHAALGLSDIVICRL